VSAGTVVTIPCKEGEGVQMDSYGENENENEFIVKVYPNPSSGDFVFEIKNMPEEKVSISVYDMLGKLVLSEITFNSKLIIGNKLTPGIYSAIVIKDGNPDGSPIDRGRQGQVKKVLKLIKTNQ
jgi:hypothetical protein